ncbi:MAG: DNA mismatch repair protein MutS [Bacteroidales bacterium]|nr:DNA mismatch repair protein MutS [Bacteroidales bacterium]
MAKKEDTPLIKQYYMFKAAHPEALLLMRVGDFYETYGEDAVIASRILGIVLTKKANGDQGHIALAGFPHHSIESYLPKMVRAGYKVAVCDQLEDPKFAKKLVKRGVTEIVTPGVAYSDKLLSQKENNFIASIYFHKDKGGIAFLDISTGTFKVAQGDLNYIDLLLADFAPKEILVQKGFEKGVRERFVGPAGGVYISTMDEWAFVYESGYRKLVKHFKTDSLKGFGIETTTLGVTAAGALLFYLESNRLEETEYFAQRGLSQICSISRIDENNFVWLDRFTIRNLEILGAASPEGISLLDIIDKTSSPMGARMLRSWIAMPSKSLPEITQRHDAVEFLLSNEETASVLEQKISAMGDLERIISRVASGRVSPREVVQLQRGLDELLPIKSLLSSNGKNAPLYREASMIEDCAELKEILRKTLVEEPAAQIGKGDVIAPGVDAELDELRNIVHNGKSIIQDIQQRETPRTGITSLKISYNNVFGYYLEVRNTHKDKVPAEWIRKQTLVSAERYITPELKEYEEKILGAEEKIYAIESRIYATLISQIQKSIPQIQRNAELIARIDTLLSFSICAKEYNYCRPLMDGGEILSIKQGRHPVIERMMKVGEEYVANDLYLDNKRQQIIILTGPNMSGKSALLRQTALIVLMAQIGSFVPAESAHIGYFDKIFTRVGASDNISRGESTFMVEMLETASILNNLTPRSLILLDEIGRGTSTFDGMSIAWAIVEYIHTYGEGAKTLFATHYHELNELEENYKKVKNFHISVKESDGKILFLRKLCEGGVAHSFGIHVARLAGVPAEVVASAEKILKRLEAGSQNKNSSINGRIKSLRERKRSKGFEEEQGVQLSIFSIDDPLLESIRDTLKTVDMNKMTPMDAFDMLRELQRKVGLNNIN